MSEVSASARHAAAMRDFGTVMELLDTQPLKLWFGVPPEELGAMLRAIPLDELRTNPNTLFVATSFFAADPQAALDEPASAAIMASNPVLSRWRTFFEGWNARTHGDVTSAYEMLRGMPDVVSAMPLRFDAEGGMRSLLLTQAALSAALVGEFREAIGLYEKALLVSPALGLEFLGREAHLRVALIHGLYGDRQIARIHYDRVRSVPRTSSWIEGQLDREEELVAALLGPEEDAAAALDVVMGLTYRHMGETWPFYVAVLQRLALEAGERRVARERIEALQATGLGGREGVGYAGSIFGQLLALDSILAGNSALAREELANADAGQWLTQQIECLLAMRSSSPRRAIQMAREMGDQTRGLRRADRRRVVLLALAYFFDGHEEEAVSLLARIGSELEPSDLRLVALLSSRMLQIAADRVPGWPPDAGVPTGDVVPELPRLTASEMKVLRGLSSGQTRSQIAKALFVSENTIKTHQRAVYRKLGVGTADQAVLAATQLGMI